MNQDYTDPSLYWSLGNTPGGYSAPTAYSISTTGIGASPVTYQDAPGYTNGYAAQPSSNINSAPNNPTPNNPTNPVLSLGLAGAPGLALGIFQTAWGQHQLDELNKTPQPVHTVSPELQAAYNEALGLKDTGISPEEKTSFQAGINRATATNIYNTQRLAGGSLSNIISGISSADQLSAQDQLVGMDASLRQKHLEDYYRMTGVLQEQKNLGVSDQITQRELLEKAYGGEEAAGISNITKGASSLAMLLPLLG